MQKPDTIDHNEVFDLAYRFVTETSENIFLTGKAGTGKTTFLKYLKDNCAKNIIVAAPTGVAAINAGGVTLHSLFQLPFHPFLPTRQSKEELLSKTRFNKQRLQLFRKAELLVIDEISMVRCDTMDAIDTILRSVTGKYSLPFGGIQLLCIGDLHQLPPVAQRQEWSLLQEYYASPFFFDSLAIKEQMPLLIELNKIYRQKEDSFIALLNKVRNNHIDKDCLDDLHQRYNPAFNPGFEEKYITLTSHNNQANQINAREIQKLLKPSFKYEAIVMDDFPENSYPADGTLVLKVGAQVMFLKNDVVQKRYFNGKIGIVKSLGKEEILVDCDGAVISVAMETWDNTRYVLDREEGKLQQEVLGSFSQFPLRLAWAITIHKSQGLTFEKVMIDAGAAFSSGQVYVALSRCTSLQGIVLLSKIPPSAIYSDNQVITGQKALTHKGSLAERFNGARQLFTQQLLEEIFSFSEIMPLINTLHTQVKEHADKVNAEALKWISDLSNNFSTDSLVASKFISLVTSLMRDQPVIEKNDLLLKRIGDAARHFEPKIASYLQEVKQHPVVTEHKEIATAINPNLNDLAIAFYTSVYYLQYCTQPFSVTSFLQHKLKFAQPRFNLSAYASGKKQPQQTGIANSELYNELKNWRDKVCEETSAPIYMVANQATLKEIATSLPLNKKDLLRIHGFGKAKVAKYGEEILMAVKEYCDTNNLVTNMYPEEEKIEKEAEIKTDSKAVSFNLFQQGKTIKQIAAERNMAIGTVEGHLAYFVGKGQIDIDKMVSTENQLLIKAAVNSFGEDSYKTLKENLPENISYNEIRMVVAALKATV